MRDRRGLLALLVLVGCARHYAYSFQLADPGARLAQQPSELDAIDDADVRAELAIDPVGNALLLNLTNKTDQVLQVNWAKVAMTRPTGNVSTLRPDADLGWITPGARASAKLFPIALPRTGSAALANEGQRFRVEVPVIVRREPRVYHFTLAAHVREQ